MLLARQCFAVAVDDSVGHRIDRERGAQARLQPQRRRVPRAAVLHGVRDGIGERRRIARRNELIGVRPEDFADAADIAWR